MQRSMLANVPGRRTLSVRPSQPASTALEAQGGRAALAGAERRTSARSWLRQVAAKIGGIVGADGDAEPCSSRVSTFGICQTP